MLYVATSYAPMLMKISLFNHQGKILEDYNIILLNELGVLRHSNT